jgi:hypothetical protein
MQLPPSRTFELRPPGRAIWLPIMVINSHIGVNEV